MNSLQSSCNDAAQSPSRRKVTFDDSKNTEQETIHVNDLSKEERDVIWVTATEFMDSKKHYTAVVRMMMKSKEPIQETDDICCRGLEFRTKEGSRKRKRTKKKAAEAVLIEQDIQRDEGIIDCKWLADVYREVSGPAALEALNRGLKDQKAVLELLEPEERLEREQKLLGPKKQPDVLQIPRRRSITETLNGGEIQSSPRCITDRK